MVFLNSRYKTQFLNSQFTILIQGNFAFQSSEFNSLFTRTSVTKCSIYQWTKEVLITSKQRKKDVGRNLLQNVCYILSFILFSCLYFRYLKVWRFISFIIFKSIFRIDYTGQQKKYTLSETSQTLFILVADSESGIHLFLSRQNFAVLPDWRFWVVFYHFDFFKKILNFLTFLCSSEKQRELLVICKEMTEIGQTVPEI